MRRRVGGAWGQKAEAQSQFPARDQGPVEPAGACGPAPPAGPESPPPPPPPRLAAGTARHAPLGPGLGGQGAIPGCPQAEPLLEFSLKLAGF